jgi:hypothetical protein
MPEAVDATIAKQRHRSPIIAVAFFAACLATIYVWLRVVAPVLAGAKAPGYPGHYASVVLHAAGGTGMLLLGALNLYIGETRRLFGAHRLGGGLYLFTGTVGAVAGFALPLMFPHEPKSTAVATAALALVWLAFAGMAWRAAHNRRYDVHRAWMIRSYAVTWTFVFCRLAMQLSFFPALGVEGVTATIWLSWVAPVILCELVLQWSSAGKR